MTGKETQQLLEQAQTYQQQMQGIIAQKEAMKMQLLEMNKALEELGKSKETEVYRLSGPVLIKEKKTAVEKDLKENVEALEARQKAMEKSEARIKEKIEELRKKLTDAASSPQKAG